jgi:hypothetical protein
MIDAPVTWLDAAALSLANGMLSHEQNGQISKYDLARWSYDMAETMMYEKLKREQGE